MSAISDLIERLEYEIAMSQPPHDHFNQHGRGMLGRVLKWAKKCAAGDIDGEAPSGWRERLRAEQVAAAIDAPATGSDRARRMDSQVDRPGMQVIAMTVKICTVHDEDCRLDRAWKWKLAAQKARQTADLIREVQDAMGDLDESGMEDDIHVICEEFKSAAEAIRHKAQHPDDNKGACRWSP